MLINHYTDHKQHTTQPPTPDKPSSITSRGLCAQQVLNVNPTACLPSLKMPNPQTHPHPPPKQQCQNAGTRNTHPTTTAGMHPQNGLPRKEVIQPHLPVRLPCYDFVPIANPTFDHSPRKTVRPWASGVTNFRDVTGGVYKARERIHRSVADLRLLATPPSWGRVADPNPN